MAGSFPLMQEVKAFSRASLRSIEEAVRAGVCADPKNGSSLTSRMSSPSVPSSWVREGGKKFQLGSYACSAIRPLEERGGRGLPAFIEVRGYGRVRASCKLEDKVLFYKLVIKPRISIARLRTLLRQFPLLGILGARQIGKSTLARWAFAGFDYLDLENPAHLFRVQRDPWLALSESKRLIVDEAQRLPELFPALRSFIDSNPRHKIILLGSASPALLSRISESLAGRISFFELPGISILEESSDAVWIRGGFPRVHWGRPKVDPAEWYPAYLRTYLEQDIPQLGFRVPSQRLYRLLSMLAHSQGSLCNLSELGGSLGISYHAVAHLLDLFEGTFLLRRLVPYHPNLKKRLVKSPKLYVRDTGLLHFLLGIPFSRRELFRHPKAGASFETFCIEQIVSHAKMADPGAEAYFYRTQTGVEIDLLLKLRGKLIPIEIKMSTGPANLRGMERGMKDLALRRGYLVNLSRGVTPIGKGLHMCGLAELLAELGVVP